MTCARCPRYDKEANHCRDGKANPRTKRDAREVAEMLGVQALCHYNPYRDAFALRTYFPARVLLHPPASGGVKRKSRTNRMQNDSDPQNPITVEET